MVVQILIDNPKSWIMPYARELLSAIKERGHTAVILHVPQEVKKGDILCLLSCEQIFKRLDLNSHNLVVHESALPQGKGWSPLTWQILEGINNIPITLFEAAEAVDAGPIYLQDTMEFRGHELINELRAEQGKKTIELILRFIDNIKTIKGIPQLGTSSYYKRRIPKDSELDINKTIADQFNLLRVSDNERYPSFFIKDGVKYIVKIEKQKID